MYPFIETIRIEDGKIWNLPYHQERMNRTMAHFWPETNVIDLKNALKDAPLTEEETIIFLLILYYYEITSHIIIYIPCRLLCGIVW